MRIRRILRLLVVAMLCSCGEADNATGPGGVSAEDAAALNKAAAEIDSQTKENPDPKSGD